ncbi:MAG: LptF/LptG family permease [Alphaproteobacteria bacterium]|nr:LptF/LptG family permease [Alphaproteobacteria bacterium]
MKFFSILGRYVNRQFILNFFVVFFAILGVIFIFDCIESLRRISGREDVSLWFAFQYAISRVTKTVEIVLPFVMMASSMITFWKLSKSNEFVVIRSAGVSMFGFLYPIIIATLLLGVANIALFNPLAAKMFEWHEVLSYRLASHNPNAVLFSSKGLWIREAISEGNVLLIQAKSMHQEDDKTLSMREVSITELDDKAKITTRYEASFALLENNVFNLKDVKVLENGKPVKSLTEYKYKTTIDMQRIKESFIEPNAISFWQLPDTIAFYEHSGFSATRHWMRYLNLLISPFLLVGMMMIGAIFMLQNTLRGSKLLLRVVSGIVIGFMVYFSSQVVYTFGVNGYIPVWLAAFTPTAIILLTTTSLLISADEV